MLKRHNVEQVNARCIIIHRCAYDPTIDQLLDWCKRQGIPVGFDIDDLIFDAELIRGNGIHFIAELPPSEQHQWLQGALSYQSRHGSRGFLLGADSYLGGPRTTHKYTSPGDRKWIQRNGACPV